MFSSGVHCATALSLRGISVFFYAKDFFQESARVSYAVWIAV